MRKDRFTDEALANAKALANIKSKDEASFAEAYDFARCQRADGTFYPIPDGKQCRKGTKASPIDPGAKRQREGQRPVVEAAKKRLKAVNARMGKIEENLVNPRKNPAVASKKLDVLEAKAARLERVKSGKEDASLRLRKELNKINSQIGRLEEKLSSPNSKNPGAIQEKIDRLERKAGKIKSVLKGGSAKKPKPEASKKRKSREEKIAELKSAIKGLKAEGAPRRGKLAKLRGDIQEQQRMRKIEADAKKTGKSVDDTIRARQAAADKKIKARLKKEQEKRDQRRKEEEAKPKLKTDFRKEIEAGAAARKKRDEGIMQRQKEEASLRRAYAQIKAKERNALRDGNEAAANRSKRAAEELLKRLKEVKDADLAKAAPKRKKASK